MKKIIITLLSMASPVMVLAHPGHGTEDPLSPYHYITNTEHLLPSVLIIAGIILINWLIYRLRKRIERK